MTATVPRDTADFSDLRAEAEKISELARGLAVDNERERRRWLSACAIRG
jgi:hypothetical protein